MPHRSRGAFFVRVRVFFLNTGDYNLPTDLLARIIEHKVNHEWRKLKFRNIDVVMSATVDMFRPEQHPLHSHQLVRKSDDPLLCRTAFYFWDNWIRYVAAELDMKATFTPGGVRNGQAEYKELARPFRGKLAFCPTLPDGDPASASSPD